VSTLNILAKKAEEGPLPYCKTGAKLEGSNQPGPLVSVVKMEFVSMMLMFVAERCDRRTCTVRDPPYLSNFYSFFE
jgi:hypothetical protein